MMNRKKIISEVAVIVILLIAAWFVAGRMDILETIVEWSRKHEEYEIDELFSLSIVLVVLLLVFSVRRLGELAHSHNALKRKNRELQDALEEIRELKGIIPICSYCKKIRDDEGGWRRLEEYIRAHSSAEFTHGICPECYRKQLEEME